MGRGASHVISCETRFERGEGVSGNLAGDEKGGFCDGAEGGESQAKLSTLISRGRGGVRNQKETSILPRAGRVRISRTTGTTRSL